MENSIKPTHFLASSEPRTMTVRRKVLVDPHMCEGHALCVHSAPDVFDVTDGDVATCSERPSEKLWDQVAAAVDACPRGAITVVEDQ